MTSFSVKVISSLFVLAACNLTLLSHCFSTNRTSSNELLTRDSHEGQPNLGKGYESAHLKEGDIKGIATHKVLGSDGKFKENVNLWPGGKVPYVIDEDGATDEMKNYIQQAIEQFDLHTCIRFVPRTNEYSYVRFFFTGKGCSSSIGKMHEPQDISLSPTSCYYVTFVMHEMMHAIGFIHEHSRPDRDNFIAVYLENVEDEENKHIFDIKMDEYIDLGSEYDIHSIMQYHDTTFAKPNTRTMVAKNEENLGPIALDGQFAQSDIYEINKLYNCYMEENKPNEEPAEEPVKEPIYRPPGKEISYSIDENGNPVTTTTVISIDKKGHSVVTTTVDFIDGNGNPDRTTVTTLQQPQHDSRPGSHHVAPNNAYS